MNLNMVKIFYLVSKITIICPKHGQFLQSPANHLRGIGCMECGGKRKLYLSEFIERANKIHDFRYTYENSVYKKNDLKIEITCTKHGSFYMTPHNHLAGQNCPVCLKESKGRTQRLTNKGFIKRAEKRMEEYLGQEKIVFLASHSAALVRKWCNKIIVMEGGRINYFDKNVEGGLQYIKKLMASDFQV